MASLPTCAVETAALAALRIFLQAQFDADPRFDPVVPDSHVVVSDQWPANGANLPPLALSILTAGNRKDDHVTEEVLSRSDKPNNQGEFTWSVKAFSQPLQLDLWAQYEVKRDLMQTALDRFLNMGPLYTLGSGEITRDGLLLKLGASTGYDGFVDFTFDGPRKIDGEATAADYQFRTLISGSVDGELTFTATTAKIAMIKLQLALGAAETPDATFTLQPVGGVMRITDASL